MRSLLNVLITVSFGLFATAAFAAHTQARLILPVETARPGDAVTVGIQLKMDPGWHTYWRNSGASGSPTTNSWFLPPGINAGEIQWPVPEKLPPDDLLTYVYENEVVLLVPLTLSSDLKSGPHEIKTAVTWLECKEQCVPGTAEISATLNIGTETKASADAPLIQTWQKKLPQSADGLSPRASWEKETAGDLRQLILEWNSSSAGEADFYPYTSSDFEVQGQVERLPFDAGKIRIRKPVKKYQGDWPKEISGLLIQKSGTEQSAYEATMPIPSTQQNRPVLAQPLWKMLLYALIGGLILNVMPCVLPVIALKILGFVGEARSEPGHVRKLGLIYALGVLVSFLALAALVIAIKAAGHQAGWGMQFSNPQFIIVLTTVVTLVALNLFGVFEVTLSGRVMGTAGNLASKHGAAGAFFNGVLATVLATPCTAPFLGASLGFAFTQSAPTILLIFSTVAIGLALPYVILSWQPAWLKFLPKPGAWMEKFKIAMGFPMLATALWLSSLVSIYYGDRSWWLGIFLVFVGLAAWVFGQFVQRGGARRGFAFAVTAALLAAGYAWALDGQLRWRSPIKDSGNDNSLSHAPEGYTWQRWSAEAVAKARSEGRPVVVDFTAKWCLTCNISVAPAFETGMVIEKLKQSNAVALLADYTFYPPEITKELAQFDRTGVPLVLVYPRDATKPPIVLPEPLPYPAPYGPVVLEALNHAAE
jgi:thiol:disulfide interchange protein DsbD